MKFFWVIHAKRIKQLSIIVIAAFMAAGFLYASRSQMVFSTPDGPQAFYRADVDKKHVALTFNISWGEQNVEPILDILEQNQIDKATFFVSALWAERYPDLVKKINESGYSIGSHGYQYKTYTEWEDDKIKKDLQRSKQILTDLTETKPTLLRPPNGVFDKRVLSIAEAQGFSIIHWSVNSYDYKNPGVETIVKNVLEEVSPGDILLFHASDSVKQTDKALPIIIDELRSDGYQFKSVEELIAQTETKNEEIK